MRYLGEATVRPATSADQEHYASVDDFVRANGYRNVLGLPNWRAMWQGAVDESNREVLGVVESTLEEVHGRRYRVGHKDLGGLLPQEVIDSGRPLSLTEHDDNSYWLVEGNQVWEVPDRERPADDRELELLLRAAARRRVQEHERRLMDARRILGEGDFASSSTTRRVIPDQVKMFVWQRDGGKCVQCGSNAELEFDHIIPLARGGGDTARNLQILCGRCNRAKGGRLA